MTFRVRSTEDDKCLGCIGKCCIHKFSGRLLRLVVHKIPCSECASSYVGQTGRRFGTRTKEHKGTVRRQDENSLLALHCLTTGHAFDWDRTTVFGKGMSEYKREFVEAWNTTSTCANQSMNLDPGYKALREYWRRRTRTRLPPVP